MYDCFEYFIQSNDYSGQDVLKLSFGHPKRIKIKFKFNIEVFDRSIRYFSER